MKNANNIGEIIAAGDKICFVAMDFSRKFKPVYEELLAPAIIDSGMRPVRSDEVLSAAGQVVAEIISIIQSARMVVIDITGSNANVLIEIGIAYALRRPMILITQDENIPFDIQALRVIHYDMSEGGKKKLKEDMEVILMSSIYPDEGSLKKYLYHSRDYKVYIIYGHANKCHMKDVYPPVDSSYMERLNEMSSETSGIWDISLAFQKLSWMKEEKYTRPIATSGYNAPDSILEKGNLFIFGGPGANPFFVTITEKLKALYKNYLTIDSTIVEGDKKRYRLYQGDKEYPENQDEMLDKGIDVGLVMRFPNPYLPGATIWVAAGIRSFGTEAAIKALVTPSMIREYENNVDLSSSTVGMWGVVRAKFDNVSQKLIGSDIYDSGTLEEK